jgi:drug/metabolite transporter (DMT)-like permease
VSPPKPSTDRSSEQPHKPLTLPAAAFALFLSTIWSGNSIAIKAGLDHAPPLRLGYLRFITGAIVVLIWAIATGADLRIRRGEWMPLLILGILFSVQLGFMNIGLNHTTAGHGAVLTVTFPIWVAVLAHFFVPGDRLTPKRLLGVIIAYGGVLLLFADSLGVDSGLLFGDVLSAISGFLLGARQVYNARIVQGLHPAKLLLSQAIFGTVVFAVASVIFESGEYLWTGRLLVSVLYQGALIAGFGFIGNLWLIQRYLPSQVSLLSLTQPIFAVILARIVLGEALSSSLWLSVTLVVVGASLVQRNGSRLRLPGIRR